MLFFDFSVLLFFISDFTATIFLLPLVFLAMTITFFLSFVLLTSILFEPSDKEFTWFFAMPRVENSLRIIEEKYTINIFWIAHLNIILLLKLAIMIGLSKIFV